MALTTSTTFDMTAANAALKELYDDQKIQNLVYRNNPFMAMVPKFTEFGGKYMPLPLVFNTSQGRSATFSNAQLNQTAAEVVSFALTRAPDYSIAQIDNQTMLASKTDKMAFINGAQLVIDNAIRAITNSISTGLFRSGTGSIGKISNISSGVITLTNPGDVVNFERNMTLQANPTDGGVSTSIRAALGYVIAVNRTAGTVTVASSALGGSAATPSGWTTSDFLLVQGDNNAKIKGLLGWLPVVAPVSGDNWFGVDRSGDTVRMAGVRYDGSAQNIEEALIDASLLVAREGGEPDVCIMSYGSYSALEKSLGAKAQYITMSGPAEIAFPGILINGANGQIKVFPDRSCPPKTAFLLQMNTWKLYSLGDAPHIARYADGLEMLRVSNADAAEVRVVSYSQLGCNAPGWNGVVVLGA
jgi:hypothetical protein